MIIFHFRMQASLKQHFIGLREHLLVAMVPIGGEEYVMGEKEVEEMVKCGAAMEDKEDTLGMDNIMQSLYKCIEKLCQASSTAQQVNNSISDTQIIFLLTPRLRPMLTQVRTMCNLARLPCWRS